MSVSASSAKPYKGLGMEGAVAKWYASLTKKSLEDFKTLAKRIAAQIPPNSKVLEVAPGPGYCAIEVANLGSYEIVGLVKATGGAAAGADGPIFAASVLRASALLFCRAHAHGECVHVERLAAIRAFGRNVCGHAGHGELFSKSEATHERQPKASPGVGTQIIWPPHAKPASR